MRSWCFWLLLFCLLAGSAHAETLTGRVSWVYDGDTIKVDGVGKVRLLGIDAPEKEASPRDDHYLRQDKIAPSTLREVAEQALRLNIKTVKGHRVSLELDRERTDRYDRTLAYVYLSDGRMLNRLLLEKGLAAVYRRFDFHYKQDFLNAEESARDQHLGLWHK